MTSSTSRGDCASTAATASASTGQRSSVWAQTMTLAVVTYLPETRSIQAILGCLEHSGEGELIEGLGAFQPYGRCARPARCRSINQAFAGRRTHSPPPRLARSPSKRETPCGHHSTRPPGRAPPEPAEDEAPPDLVSQ